MNAVIRKSFNVASILLAGASLFGCNGTEMIAGEALGYHDVDIEKANLPFVDDEISGDPNHLTLAVKFVEYIQEDGQPILTAEEVKNLVKGMNNLVKVCNFHFRVEEYVPVTAADFGLANNPRSMGELDGIRSQFDSDRHLVVVNTGSWGLPANAWTAMPGSTPSGAVVEAPVANDAPLVAHELGHYLNLDHASDPANMMSPTIYKTSTFISQGQCADMRQAALTVRSGALRS
jgi:hypothetical protein